MMDQELKAKWVAALRSGNFKQTTAALELNGCNCCLGVLARLQDIPSTKPARYSKELFRFPIGNSTETFDSVGFPPDGFCGLEYEDIREVANMNDSGSTFEEIANHIEGKF